MTKRRLFLACMPKAGTHLLTEVVRRASRYEPIPLDGAGLKSLAAINRLARALPSQRFCFYAHARARTLPLVEDSGLWRIGVLIRDPRDALLSMRDFLKVSPHAGHREIQSMLEPLSADDQLIMLIDGVRTPSGYRAPPWSMLYEGWMEWGGSRRIIRYEDILGGNLRPLTKLLKMDLECVEQAVSGALQSTSPTKNKAVRHRWTTEMSDRVLAYAQSADSGQLVRLGYSWQPNEEPKQEPVPGEALQPPAPDAGEPEQEQASSEGPESARLPCEAPPLEPVPCGGAPHAPDRDEEPQQAPPG